jgi:acyl-CoA thioesterase-1
MHSGTLRRLVIGGVSVVLLLAVASPAVSAWKQGRANQAVERACDATAAQAVERNAVVRGTGSKRVTVLGDSYSAGYGVALADSWPSLSAAQLGAAVTVRSLGGTGYAASPCGPHDTFADRAASVRSTRPDLVIVQGGLNDVLASPEAIRAGATRMLDSLGGVDVVLVGPPAAPKWTAEAKRVDRTLASFAAAHHVRYVSTLYWPLTFSADGIHPDAAGYRVFAHRVAEAVR